MGDGEDDHPIHQVNTVPPPQGEDDAYSAETKVTGTSDVALQELMRAAIARDIATADDDDVGHEDATRLFPIDSPFAAAEPSPVVPSKPGPPTVEVAPDDLVLAPATAPAATAGAARQPFPLLPVSLALVLLLFVTLFLFTR
jgi:hypothetical protein